MDIPKLGLPLPKLPKPAEDVGDAAAKAVGQVADQIAGGASEAAVTFERVSDSAFSALANVPFIGPAVGDAREGLEGTIRQAGLLGQFGERAAEELKGIAGDPAAFAGNMVRAAVDGGSAFVQRGAEHLRQGILDQVEDTGLLDKGAGSEGVAHAIGIVTRRVAEFADDRIGAALDAARPVAGAADIGGALVDGVGSVVNAAIDGIGDTAADVATGVASVSSDAATAVGGAAEAVGDAVGTAVDTAVDAVGDTASDVATGVGDVLGDAAGAAWDAVTGGESD
jgi:hypothetical protein